MATVRGQRHSKTQNAFPPGNRLGTSSSNRLFLLPRRRARPQLNAPQSDAQLALLGQLMLQSHVSYSGVGLGSPNTDLLVELVEELGPGRGLYGAKITGGGSGGTVCVLGAKDAEPAVQEAREDPDPNPPVRPPRLGPGLRRMLYRMSHAQRRGLLSPALLAGAATVHGEDGDRPVRLPGLVAGGG